MNVAAVESDGPDAARGWRSLFFLCLIGWLSSVDIQLIYLLLEPIKRDLQLTDAQLAIITGSAVAVVSAVAAFPIGWLADRYGRRLMLACSVLFWSLMTGLCGLARSYEAFLLASVGLALGEAGLYAIMYALIPQIVPPRNRMKANAILLGVLVISGALGLLTGTWFLSLIEEVVIGGLESWRVVLIAAGLAGPLFAAMVLGIRVDAGRPRNPTGRSGDIAAVSALSLVHFLRRSGLLIGTVFLGLSLYGSAWSAWLVWSPALFAREFGRSPVDAGFLIGIANLTGCIAALMIARFAVNRWHPRLQHRFTIRTLTVSCSIALLPVLLILRTDSAPVFLMAFGVLITFLTLAVTIAPGLVQDIAPARYRSSVTGLMPLVALPVRIVAPIAIGLISDSSASHGLLVGVCTVSAACLALAVGLLAATEARYSRLAVSIAEADGLPEGLSSPAAP